MDGDARNIDGDAQSINGNAQSINGDSRSINGDSRSINGDSRSINGEVQNSMKKSERFLSLQTKMTFVLFSVFTGGNKPIISCGERLSYKSSVPTNGIGIQFF